MHGNLHNINRPEHYTDQVRFFAVHCGIHKCFMFYLCAWDIRFLCSYNAHESFSAKSLYIALLQRGVNKQLVSAASHLSFSAHTFRLCTEPHSSDYSHLAAWQLT